MTTVRGFSLIEKMEAYAQAGHYGLKVNAWEKDIAKLEREGIIAQCVSPTSRLGEVSCYLDWSECSIDNFLTFSPKDPSLTRGNRLWLMAYKANNPDFKIDI